MLTTAGKLARQFLIAALLPVSFPLFAITPYEAVYSVHFGPFHLGDGTYRLQALADGSYQFTFNSYLSLLLLSDQRDITSNFLLIDEQVQSRDFEQQRSGIGKDFVEIIHWDKPRHRISSSLNNDLYTIAWRTRVYDALNAQLQIRLDLVNGRNDFNYELMMSNKTDNYRWINRGEEILVIDNNNYPAIKFEMQREGSDKQTFTWFATEMDFLPLRVLYTIKGSGSIDMRLKNYVPLEGNAPGGLTRPEL